MSDVITVEPGEDVQAQPSVASRLIPAGQPAGQVIETLVAAIGRGTISPKLGREMLVRLVPPAKAAVRLALPKITDAASYAAATQRIMRASSTGKISPADAAVLLRNAKATFQAVSAANRARFAF